MVHSDATTLACLLLVTLTGSSGPRLAVAISLVLDVSAEVAAYAEAAWPGSTPLSLEAPAESGLEAVPVQSLGDGQEEEEEVVDEVAPALTVSEERKPKSKRAPEEGADEVPLHDKVRFSANVSVSTKQKAENAAYWVPGLTISAVTEVALEREIRELEKEFNGGRPFEKAGKLKYGRPRGEG
ncbi:MAG: hypothetical protein L0Z62_24270 [Gemmataceae bacterium]|nr:hypothetical protein [Gemmataceae bacterium]